MHATAANTLDTPALYAQVAERLRARIFAHELLPGSWIDEQVLAAEYGISRTPMREAVRRASEAGLLILRKNRAPLIRAFTPHDVDCLYQIREIMEVLALKQAWHRMPGKEIAALRKMAESVGSASSKAWIARCLAFDEALHKIWFDHCQNPWLTQFLQSSRVFIRIFQHMMARDPALVRKSYDQHLAILETLGTTDLQLGTRLLREHIRASALKVKQHMEGKIAAVI